MKLNFYEFFASVYKMSSIAWFLVELYFTLKRFDKKLLVKL